MILIGWLGINVTFNKVYAVSCLENHIIQPDKGKGKVDTTYTFGIFFAS